MTRSIMVVFEYSIIWQDYDHPRSPSLGSCQINFIELEALEQVPDGIRIISPPYRHPEIDKIGNVKDWIFLSDFWLIDTKNYVMILSVVHGSFLILEYWQSSSDWWWNSLEIIWRSLVIDGFDIVETSARLIFPLTSFFLEITATFPNAFDRFIEYLTQNYCSLKCFSFRTTTV